MKKLSGWQKDFIASDLRSHLLILRHLFEAIENDSDAEQNHTIKSLERVEGDLRRLRNYFLIISKDAESREAMKNEKMLS